MSLSTLTKASVIRAKLVISQVILVDFDSNQAAKKSIYGVSMKLFANCFSDKFKRAKLRNSCIALFKLSNQNTTPNIT